LAAAISLGAASAGQRELVRLVQEGEVELTNEEVESQAWRD
jgi:hypothetical protein